MDSLGLLRRSLIILKFNRIILKFIRKLVNLRKNPRRSEQSCEVEYFPTLSFFIDGLSNPSISLSAVSLLEKGSNWRKKGKLSENLSSFWKKCISVCVSKRALDSMLSIRQTADTSKIASKEQADLCQSSAQLSNINKQIKYYKKTNYPTQKTVFF